MLKGFYMEEKMKKIDTYITFIALFMLLIIPILSYKYEFLSISPIVMENSYGTGMKMDLFNFYKSIALYIGSGVIFSLFMYKVLYLEYKFKETKINIIFAIFSVAIVLSAILSGYKEIALMGNFDRHEGALAWFCYLVVIFTLFNTKIETKYVKYFYYILIPFLLINLFLGLANLYGYDILKTDFIQKIMGGNGTIGGVLWTTLYHFNFMSGIAAVMFGISFTYLLLEEDKKQKIILFLGSLISFTIVLASNSIGGFMTSVVIIPIILPIVWNLVDKKQIAIWSVLVLASNLIIYVVLNKQNPIVYTETFALFEKINNISSLIIPLIVITYLILLFIISKLDSKKFLNYTTIIILAIVSISIFIYSHKLNIENKLIESNPNDTTIVRMKDSKVFKKINEISTDRLNIWTKTIDLINKKPVFGYGFDTFPYVLASSDGNLGISTYGEFIDKPHNWYLTLTYGSGVISLICLLAIIVYILRGVVYSCVDGIQDKYIYIFGIGAIAYAIQGMFNDSLVGTSIFFWIFAGVCVNRLNKQTD